MKYVIVIPDGCADEPQESLGGKTPLEAAKTPAMDQVAKFGLVGRANHTPAHLTAGSAVANMSLLGYDPNEHFSGRAPLEAAAQGIEFHVPLGTSKALAAVIHEIRAKVPPYDEDRFFSPDIEAVRALVRSGKLSAHLPFDPLSSP